MSLHAARLEHSPRLQRVAALLADGLEHSTLNIVAVAQVCAVNSIVAELRDNGLHIACVRRGDVWFYRELTLPKVAALATGQIEIAALV